MVISVIACYLILRFGLLWYFNADSRIPGDFNVYWVAAERLVGGERFYVSTDGSPFKYSPTFAYVFRYSIFLLEKKFAAALWMVASVVCCFGALFQMGNRFLEKKKCERRILVSIVVGIFLSWRGFLETLSYGQVDLFLGAGLLWIASSMINNRKGKTYTDAIFRVFLSALLLTVKPHMALILLPVCLVFGRKECLGFFSLTLMMYLLPTLWIGTDAMVALFREWILCLREQQGVVFMTGNINQAVGAVLARLFGDLGSVGVLSTVGILVYASAIGVLALPNIRHSLRGRQSTEVKLCWMAYGISGYLLFSPLSWRWFIFLWVPVVAILTYLEERSMKVLSVWALLAISTNGVIAHLLGLSVADRVSFLGLYMWASFTLFLITVVQLRKLLRDDQCALNALTQGESSGF